MSVCVCVCLLILNKPANNAIAGSVFHHGTEGIRMAFKVQTGWVQKQIKTAVCFMELHFEIRSRRMPCLAWFLNVSLSSSPSATRFWEKNKGHFVINPARLPQNDWLIPSLMMPAVCIKWCFMKLLQFAEESLQTSTELNAGEETKKLLRTLSSGGLKKIQVLGQQF